MFGYNYLATLISKRMSAMEVYADQLLSTFAVLHSSAYSAVEAPQCDAVPDQSLTMKSM
jgi:hypothetical protein